MHNQTQIDADKDSLSAHLCPETARDLKPLGKDAVRAHIRSTFEHAGQSNLAGTDYQRRADALAEYFELRFKERL